MREKKLLQEEDEPTANWSPAFSESRCLFTSCGFSTARSITPTTLRWFLRLLNGAVSDDINVINAKAVHQDEDSASLLITLPRRLQPVYILEGQYTHRESIPPVGYMI